MVAKSLLEKAASYSDVAISFVDDDGYPFSLPVTVEVDQENQTVRITKPASLPSLLNREISLTFNHITPLPVGGYTDRRYIVLWGRLTDQGDSYQLKPAKGYIWDEKEVPFFQYSEMKVTKARQYLNELKEKPWLSTPWLIMRTFRLPFVIATILPVAIGAAVAFRAGHFDLTLFALTLAGALLLHLGVNTANDYFDSRLGADDINTTPTPYSGGSRVIQYGLLPGTAVLSLSTSAYLAGSLIGLYLAFTRGLPVLLIGLVGLVVSWGYTAPPLKLAYRGLGELVVGLGFGPLLVLGAYYVQAQTVSIEAGLVSIPLGLLVMLILYVNEVPDRTWDDEAGKKTFVSRMSEDSIVKGYELAMASVYGVILLGSITRIFPLTVLLALLTVPMAVKEARLIGRNLGNTYGLVVAMSSNIKIFVYTALFMLIGYLISFFVAV